MHDGGAVREGGAGHDRAGAGEVAGAGLAVAAAGLVVARARADEARDDLLKNLKKDFVACLKAIRNVEASLKQVEVEISKALGN